MTEFETKNVHSSLLWLLKKGKKTEIDDKESAICELFIILDLLLLIIVLVCISIKEYDASN